MSTALPVLVLMLIGLIWNAVLVTKFGMFTGGDSVRYIDGAARMLSGEPLIEKQSSYRGYVAVVAVCRALGLGLHGVVVVQVLVAIAAALVLFLLCRAVLSRGAAFVAALFFLVNPDIARWNLYILTDSLYISFVIFTCAAILWAPMVRAGPIRTFSPYAIACALTIATALLRPNGWLFLVIAPIWWIRSSTLARRWKVLLCGSVAVAALSVTIGDPSVREKVEAESPGHWLREGVVIWSYDRWRVPMPTDHTMARGRCTAHDCDWVADLGYAARHPFASARLAATRVAAEVAHVRPFYSFRHNAITLLTLTVIYALAAIGFSRNRRRPLFQLFAYVVAAHLLVVALTFADWDGRFLLYVLPLIVVFATAGARNVLERAVAGRTM